MKRIILGAIILLLVNFAAMAQTVRNETNCPVNVTRECYDICVLVSTNTITVQPGQTLSFALTPCPYPSNGVIYTVCWRLGEPCLGQPPVPCTSVDGSPVAPSPCSPGTYTGAIQFCDRCAPNGVARVTFDPSTNHLTIEP